MPEPGFHLGVSFDEYVSWDAMNQSTLCGFSKTPAHVRYQIDTGGKKRTLALDLGWLLHLATLEPDLFASTVMEAPKVDGRTKIGKATIAKFAADHPDATVVKPDTFAQVKAMADSVLSHETAGPFFTGRGQNEISMLWEDKEHGVRCKARLDKVGVVNEYPVLGDLKSSRDASRRAFERSISQYQYEVQAAHYLAGCEAIAPIEPGNPFRRFFFFVVESVPPYLTAAYEIGDAALEEGRIKRSRYIRKWKECIETGVWPGFPAGVEYVSLPPWAFRNYVDE